MLTLIVVLIFLFVSTMVLIYFTGWILPEKSAGEIEVKLSPRRAIEEMTVSEFRDLAGEYLMSRGYSVDREGEDLLVSSEDERFTVQFDFRGEASNPRTINGLIVDQKKRDSDRLILFTLASVEGQALKLVERSGIEIIEPEPIIEWKRDRDSS